MTWSSSGSAATYPTVTVTKFANGYSGSLVVRVDPGSGIAYLTGSVTLTTGSYPVGNLVAADPLPPAFRPIVAVSYIYAVAGPTMGMTLGTDGTLRIGISNTTGGTATYRSFYFTNTNPS